MVRVHVGADDADDGLTLQLVSEDFFPQGFGLFVTETGVHNPPAFDIFKQVKVDEAQGAGHWHGQPAYAGGDFHGCASVGSLGKRISYFCMFFLVFYIHNLKV